MKNGESVLSVSKSDSKFSQRIHSSVIGSESVAVNSVTKHLLLLN